MANAEATDSAGHAITQQALRSAMLAVLDGRKPLFVAPATTQPATPPTQNPYPPVPT
jgi:hypothetical protein